MYVLALALIIAVVALAYQQRQYDQRTLEREQAWRLERTALLNRIQAPEAAPYMEDDGDDSAQYIGFEDDEAFNEVSG